MCSNLKQSRCRILSGLSLVRPREKRNAGRLCPESGFASALALLSPVFTLVWREAIQHLYHPAPYLQPRPETFPLLSQLEVLTGKERRMNVKKELIVSMTLALCARKSQKQRRALVKAVPRLMRASQKPDLFEKNINSLLA